MSVTVIDAVARIRPDFGNTMGSLSLIERGFALALPLALGASAAAMVKLGMDGQTQLNIVAALTGTSSAQMDRYTAALEGMGVQMGFTLAESAKGLYYVVSAGYKGADALEIVKLSMEHAAAAGAPLKEVTYGLTAALNAYGGHIKDATKYSDIFTLAVTYGVQTTEDFANHVSNAALMAASAHVPFMQLAAAETSLTDKGVHAAQAFTGLSFMMSKIAVPSADAMAKSVEKLGGHLDISKYQSADLMGKLLLLRNATGLSEDAFIKLVGGTRSAKAALGLLTDGGAAYYDILKKMQDGTGRTADAFKTHTQTMAFAFDQVKASVSNAGYELIKLITPAVIPFLQGIAAAAGRLPDLFQAIGSVLGDTITKVDGPMQTFGRHTGEVSQILNTHKGLLSQVGDAIKPLFDSFTTLTRHTANFRGDIVATSTEVQRHKGLLSQLGDFVRGTLVPTVMHLAQVFQTNILPVIAQVATFVQTQLIPTFKAVAGFIVTDVVPVLITLAGWIGKHVVPILSQLATIFRENVLPAVKQVWTSVAQNLLPAVEHLWTAIQPLVSILLNGLGWVLQHIIGPALALLINIIGHVIDVIATIISWIVNFIGKLGDLLGRVGDAKDKFGDFLGMLGKVKDFIGGLIGKIGDLIGMLGNIHLPDFGGIHLPGFAEGGVMPGGAAIVGENGPELALFPTGTRVIPAAQTAALMGGSGSAGGNSGGGSGGGYRTANITIMLDSRVLAQGLQQPLVDGIRIATGIRR